MKKMSEEQWESRKKLIVIVTTVLFVFTLIGSAVGIVAFTRTMTPPPNNYVSANIYSRLEFQAINTVQAMLSARPDDKKILSEIYGGRGDLPNLNETPASVVTGSANVTQVTPPFPIGDGGTYRSFVTVGISYTTAGNSEILRSYFKTPFLIQPRENAPAIVTPESLPVVVKPDNKKLGISPGFGTIAPIDSQIGIVVDGFVKAYYGRNGADALTRYTTPEFSLSADKDPMGDASVFSNVETLRIKTEKSGASLDEGETMAAFVTIRLSNNAATYINNEVFLILKKQAGDHWLIHGFTEDYPAPNSISVR